VVDALRQSLETLPDRGSQLPVEVVVGVVVDETRLWNALSHLVDDATVHPVVVGLLQLETGHRRLLQLIALLDVHVGQTRRDGTRLVVAHLLGLHPLDVEEVVVGGRL
jgi:hypothetical protein